MRAPAARGLHHRQPAHRAAIDELLVAVHVPKPEHRARSAFLKLGARRYLVISIVMAAGTIEVADRRIVSARLAVGACSAVAQRLPALEASLVGASLDPRSLADRVQGAHLGAVSPIDDVRGSADYRREAVATLLRRLMCSSREDRLHPERCSGRVGRRPGRPPRGSTAR
jgi:CO/xanthine dehydrogenase FAD-binding subunit